MVLAALGAWVGVAVAAAAAEARRQVLDAKGPGPLPEAGSRGREATNGHW